MVHKDRLSGFVDGIIAVIMTIMLLEFRLPVSGSLMDFFRENLVYLIAYLLSFIYVIVSWFNQQYMMRLAENITRRVYFSCMLWVLSLSILPLLSAWAGRTMDLFHDLGLNSPKAPALLFFGMIFLWSRAYTYMSRSFIEDAAPQHAKQIQSMPTYRFLSSPFYLITVGISVPIIWLYPPFTFIFTAFEMLVSLIKTRENKIKTSGNKTSS